MENTSKKDIKYQPQKFIENTHFSSLKALFILTTLFGIAVICTTTLIIVADLIVMGEQFTTSTFLEFIFYNQGFSSLAVLASLIFIITFLIWVKSSYENLYSFNLKTFVTPGWTIGHYLIPIINLFQPYKDMKEIWGGSQLSNNKGYRLIVAWWFFWIFHIATYILSSQISEDINESSTIQNIYDAIGIEIVANIAYIISIAFTLIVVFKISELQEKKWSTGSFSS